MYRTVKEEYIPANNETVEAWDFLQETVSDVTRIQLPYFQIYISPWTCALFLEISIFPRKASFLPRSQTCDVGGHGALLGKMEIPCIY